MIHKDDSQIMNGAIRNTIVLLALLIFPGCIVSDQITTLIIQPGGSAEVIVVRSNIHFRGNDEKREEELEEYRRKFNDGEQFWFDRIQTSGGAIKETRWIKQSPPMANYLRGSLPNQEAVEKLFTLDNKWKIRTNISTDGSTRTIKVTVTPPPEKKLSAPPADPEKIRKKLANSISHTRIAIQNGKITDARGFVVANDKQSALVDQGAFPDRLWKENKRVKLVLAWRHN